MGKKFRVTVTQTIQEDIEVEEFNEYMAREKAMKIFVGRHTPKVSEVNTKYIQEIK